MLESLTGAVDGKAFVVKQFPNTTDQQDFMMLIVATVAASFDRSQLGEFLFPVAQHVRLDCTQFGYLTNGEIALGRNRREFSRLRAFQGWRLLPGI